MPRRPWVVVTAVLIMGGAVALAFLTGTGPEDEDWDPEATRREFKPAWTTVRHGRAEERQWG